MHQMTVDVEQGCAVVLGANDVCVKKFVVERAASHDVQTTERVTNQPILCACSSYSSARKAQVQINCRGTTAADSVKVPLLHQTSMTIWNVAAAKQSPTHMIFVLSIKRLIPRRAPTTCVNATAAAAVNSLALTRVSRPVGCD